MTKTGFLPLLSTNPEVNLYSNKVVVDSWNNIKKYSDITGAFFIFDEQRVVGSGAWVKSFLKIAKANKWVLLTATPGDSWMDYIPVFVANGFYRNRAAFTREHVIYRRYSNFYKVDSYRNTGTLIRLRRAILVTMDYKREAQVYHENVYLPYNVEMYRDVTKTRWDPYKNEPIINAAALCYIWRKIVNSDESRQKALLEFLKTHPRIIVFYNFNYELELLKSIDYGTDIVVAQWNGCFCQAKFQPHILNEKPAIP